MLQRQEASVEAANLYLSCKLQVLEMAGKFCGERLETLDASPLPMCLKFCILLTDFISV